MAEQPPQSRTTLSERQSEVDSAAEPVEDRSPVRAIDRLQEALRSLADSARTPKFRARLALAEEQPSQHEDDLDRGRSDEVESYSSEPALPAEREDVSATPQSSEPDGLLDQQEIEALMAEALGTEEPEQDPAPEFASPVESEEVSAAPQSSEPDGLLDQQEIEALMAEALGAEEPDQDPAPEFASPVESEEASAAPAGLSTPSKPEAIPAVSQVEAVDPALEAEVAYGDDDALADLDRDLAGGVDDLIDGSFEAVSALLEAVFDERGHIDLTDDEPKAFEELSVDQPLSDSGAAVAEAISDAVSLSEEVLPDSAAEEPAPVTDVTEQEEEVSAAPPLDEELLEGTGVIESPETVAESPVEEPAKASAAVSESASPRSPETPSRPSPSVEAPAEGGKPSVLQHLAARMKPIVAHAARSAGGALKPLSLPIRVLPPQVRSVVDLFVLTIVLWVPLVWIAVALHRVLR